MARAVASILFAATLCVCALAASILLLLKSAGPEVAPSLLPLLGVVVGAVLGFLSALAVEWCRRKRVVGHMRLMLAYELSTHLRTLTDMKDAKGDDELWRFCVHAETHLPLAAYSSFLQELPALDRSVCDAVVRAYHESQLALAEALRIREKDIGPKHAKFPKRKMILNGILDKAIPKVGDALKSFDEGKSRLRDMEAERNPPEGQQTASENASD